MKTNQNNTANLPIRFNLKPIYALSLVIAILMTLASVAGILLRIGIYSTDELVQSFVPNDVVNLFIGLPILLGSMWMTRRGQLIGLLFWPGALFFVLYNYIAYVFSLPFHAFFLFYILLVALSAYTVIGLVAGIDGKAVQKRLAGVVPERVAGIVLVGLGILVFLRAIGVVFDGVISRRPPVITEFSILVSDFMINPAWIIGGVLLWRREALGYVAGMGLLFQASMLFIGLIFFMILQPLLTAAPFNPVDVAAVFIMGLVSFIPSAIFVRGVVSKRDPLS